MTCIRFSAFLLSLVALTAAEAATYRVKYDPGANHLHVTACFTGQPPAELVAQDARAARYVEALGYTKGSPGTPTRSGKRIRLDGMRDGGCIAYGVDLEAASAQSWRGPAMAAGGGYLVSPHLFIWPPAHASRNIEIAFDLPPGIAVSTPWLRSGGNDTRREYNTGPRPFSWNARIAIGTFDTEHLELPGGAIDVAILDGEPPPDRKMIIRWLRRNAEALSLVYGRLPVAHLQVIVVPLGRGGEPVPWGQIMRGGGDAAHLYIDQTQSEDAFMSDWVLIHELSHLLHPFMRGNGRWLYEGLASYYQNVLRGRGSLLPPRRAWERLHAGFQRGIAGTRTGQTLAAASEAMLRERSFMRVYWSGAAIALLADIELRERSDGVMSLDSVLSDLQRCCLPGDRYWTDRQVIAKLDELSGTDIFQRLYRRYIDSDRFPDLEAAYRKLGLRPTSDTTLAFAGAGTARALRRAIMDWD